MSLPTPAWPGYRLFLFRFFLSFVVLFILSFPFGYRLVPEAGDYARHFFEPLAKFTGEHIFRIKQTHSPILVSDSIAFYVNAFNILLLAALLALLWGLIFRHTQSHEKLLHWFNVFVRYYLASQLLIYGFSKLFKVQFYLPEPNILYTKLGEMPRDLLYWTTMGISRPYSIFLGTTEILAASLLLFRRTTFMGAIFATFLLINIAAINFAFDISVKLLSCFLLLLSVYLVAQDRKKLRLIMGFGPSVDPGPVYLPEQRWNKQQKLLYLLTKVIVIAVMLLESLWVYIKADNFNDDTLARPYLHGAYEVKTFIRNNDTLPPLLTDTIRWKRIFFHRKGYFIIEQMNDEMVDYKMNLDTARKELYIFIEDSAKPIIFSYQDHDPSLLVLEEINEQAHLKVVLKRLDESKMRLLKKEFSWTID